MLNAKLSTPDFDQALTALKKEYKIFAPARFPGRGRFSDTDLIKYAEVNSSADIVWQ